MEGFDNLHEELSTIVDKAVEDYFLIARANRGLVGLDLVGWVRQQTNNIPIEVSRHGTQWVLSVCSDRQTASLPWLRYRWRAPKWLATLFLIGGFDRIPRRDLMSPLNADDTKELLSMIDAIFGIRVATARDYALARIPVWIAQHSDLPKSLKRGRRRFHSRRAHPSAQFHVPKPAIRISADSRWHNEDYSSVWLYGEEVVIRNKVPDIIRFMDAELEKGIRYVRGARIMQHIGRPKSKMKNLLRNSPVWMTLLVGDARGNYWLDLPVTMASKTSKRKRK